MKRFITLSGLMLLAVLAGTGCRNTGRNMEERFDHFRMHRRAEAMEFRDMRGMAMRNERRAGPWNRMENCDCNVRPGEQGPGFMRIDRIPNLTDEQRKAISDLRVKQMEEMDRLHEETFAKMQSMKESHRKAMMSILTDEQKKMIESGGLSTDSDQSPVNK